jgi:hypothetical protein
VRSKRGLVVALVLFEVAAASIRPALLIEVHIRDAAKGRFGRVAVLVGNVKLCRVAVLVCTENLNASVLVMKSTKDAG